jgi:hypothetical protein
VIGGWRENYRIDPKGVKDKIQLAIEVGRNHPVGRGPKVEAADQTIDGHKFSNIDEFKKLILADPDTFARNLTQKLLIYGTGHGLEFADRDVVAKIVADVKPKHYGFRTMIHDVVESSTFRSK